MKTPLDFLDQVAQFRHSEFLHRLDLRQTRNIAIEAMELYADYKNKDLLLRIAIYEQRIVMLRQLLDKSGLSEITTHDGSDLPDFTSFTQWMAIIKGMNERNNVLVDLEKKEWQIYYDLGYPAGRGNKKSFRKMSKAIEFLETRLGLDSNVSGKDRVDSNIIDIAEIMEDYADYVIKKGWVQAFKIDSNER